MLDGLIQPCYLKVIPGRHYLFFRSGQLAISIDRQAYRTNPGEISVPHHDSDEDDEIRDVEGVESKRPRPRSRPRHDDDDEFDDEETDVVGTLIPYKNGLALGAYYCGVFGLIPILGIILGPSAIVLGILGLRYSRKNPKAKGGGHAITGIILGGLSTVGHIGIGVLAGLGYFFAK
jgi:hypothetical protein